MTADHTGLSGGLPLELCYAARVQSPRGRRGSESHGESAKSTRGEEQVGSEGNSGLQCVPEAMSDSGPSQTSPSTCISFSLGEGAGGNEPISVTVSQRNFLMQKAVEARTGSSPFNRDREREEGP